ncbi:MAG: hypothetical protein ACXABN_08235 [Candidatus Thorarchaeota archaeon]
MSQLLEARRSLRRKVNANEKLDRFLHVLIVVVLTTNIVLILYAMLSITLRMTLGGVWLVDTLPIALYILPLLIFLPLMLRAYYRERTAAANFGFLVVTSVFFGILSSLVRGFLICLLFNVIALVALFVLGRFRPKGNVRKVGKKSIAYFLLLNMLGLSFPVSIVLMGNYPIAVTTPQAIPYIALTVPLTDFDFPFQNLTPTSGLLTEIWDNGFILDFKVLETSSSSWSNLRPWLVAINETELEYTVTLVADRESLAGDSPDTLATTDLIEDVYLSHMGALSTLLDVSLVNITNTPETVLFDMTLSQQEWQALMIQTRSLNLIGFGGLLRTSLYSTQPELIESSETSLRTQAVATGLKSGLVVESFVVDDMQDRDTGAMRFCGINMNSLFRWDVFVVSCERSRFSFEMNGDVGEYLTHSFASTVGNLGNHWGLRLGETGNTTDILDRQNSVYEDLDVLVNDIGLAIGNDVMRLTIGSLPSLLSTHGSNVLTDIRSAIDPLPNGEATYTFRIYAFRAVFMAIDAFDFIML